MRWISGMSTMAGDIFIFDKNRRMRCMQAITPELLTDKVSPSFEIWALLFSKRQTISSASVFFCGFDRFKFIIMNRFNKVSCK